MTVVKSEVAPEYALATTIEQVVIVGDLAQLKPEQRVAYYKQVCESIGLNPLTKPFSYITLNGKLTLYANRDAADQLRKRDGVSVAIADRSLTDGVYVVTARATLPDGRVDESTGAVYIDKLQGEARANAMMKAETKAKRRVTLSICGLGWLDETEVETVPDAKPFDTAALDAPKPHWLDDPPKRAAFFAAVEKRGLVYRDIKELLHKEHLHEWTGTAQEALDAIDAAIAAKTKEVPA